MPGSCICCTSEAGKGQKGKTKRITIHYSRFTSCRILEFVKGAILCLLLGIATPLSAQRSLHWRDVAIDARLTEDGTLRVVETQTIVFTGPWNGGERRFDVRPRQHFRFEGIRRVDSTGRAHVMHEGNLGVMDGYALVDGNTLRWRSRLPTDPPFNESPITYVLEYSYRNILVPDGRNWVLDHDFGFGDRSGVIENFSVTLHDLEPNWQPTMAFNGKWQGRNLLPGEGFVVRVPLRYVGDSELAVSTGADPIERALLVGVTLLLLGSIGKRLYTREKSTGRLDPLPSPDGVDEKWLEENVFVHLPEVVGAAWDNSTSAAEVAAVLARLVADGRMKSDVRDGGFFGGPVLHLELLADRGRFHGYELKLIDALFERGETTTDTGRIRARYKRSGFDPSEKIRKPLQELVDAMVRANDPHRSSPLPSLFAFLFSIPLLAAAVGREPADAPLVVGGAAAMIVCYFIALGGAAVWRNRIHDVGRAALWFLVPIGIPLVVLLTVLASGVTRASVLALAGLCCLWLALANSVFNQARSRESLDRIALRRRLAVARSYFIRELRRDEPRLKDAWFPYLIAFGLGKHMDRWFAAFGGESEPMLSTVGYSSGSGSHGGHGHSGGGWTGFGGGAGFSGGGSSGSWTTAVGVMAAGVSAPSSSSGGGGSGGGGGGGSSGGGGGGGW